VRNKTFWQDGRPQSSRIDPSNSNAIYEGWCQIGKYADTDKGVWRISKTDSNGDRTWAEGTYKDTKIWNNRATYAYS